jgi:hypothetical protein
MLLPAYTRYTGQLTTERNNDRDFNLSQGLLLCSEGLAAHRSVDGIEGAQAMKIRDAVNGDRIADRQHLAIRVGEYWPCEQAWAVWIS